MLVPPNVLGAAVKALKSLFQETKTASERVKDDVAALDPRPPLPVVSGSQNYFDNGSDNPDRVNRYPQWPSQFESLALPRSPTPYSFDGTTAGGLPTYGLGEIYPVGEPAPPPQIRETGDIPSRFNPGPYNYSDRGGVPDTQGMTGEREVYYRPPGLMSMIPPESPGKDPSVTYNPPKPYDPAYDVPIRPAIVPATFNIKPFEPFGSPGSELLLPDLLQEQVPVRAPKPYDSSYDVAGRPYDTSYDVPKEDFTNATFRQLFTPGAPGRDPQVEFGAPDWMKPPPDYVPPSQIPYYLRDENDPVLSTYASAIGMIRDTVNGIGDLSVNAFSAQMGLDVPARSGEETPQQKLDEARADMYAAKQHLYLWKQYWDNIVKNYTPKDTYLGVRKTPEQLQAEQEARDSGTLDSDYLASPLEKSGLAGTGEGSIYNYLINTWPGTVVTGSVLTALDTLNVPFQLTAQVAPTPTTPSTAERAADFMYYAFGYAAKNQPAINALVNDRLNFYNLPVFRQVQLMEAGIEGSLSGSRAIASAYMDAKMAPVKIATYEDNAKKLYFESFVNPDLPEKAQREMRYLAFALQQEASQLKTQTSAEFAASYYNILTALPINIFLDPVNLLDFGAGIAAKLRGFGSAYEMKQFNKVARTAERGAAVVEDFTTTVTGATRAADAAANAPGPARTFLEKQRLYEEAYAEAIIQSEPSKAVQKMLTEAAIPAGQAIIDPLNPLGSFKDAIKSIFQPLAFSKVESAVREAHGYAALLLTNVRNSADAKTILRHVFAQTGQELKAANLTDPVLHLLADAKGNYPLPPQLLGQQTFQELVRLVRPVLDQIDLFPSLTGKSFPMDKFLDDLQNLVEKGAARSYGIEGAKAALPVNAVKQEYAFENGEHLVKVMDINGKQLRPERFPTELAAKKYIDDLKEGNYTRNKFYDFFNPIVKLQSILHLSTNPGAILVNGLSGHLQINANYGWKFRDGVADMARIEKFTSGVNPYKPVYDAIQTDQAVGRTLKDKVLGYRQSINPLGEANSYRMAYGSVFNDTIHAQITRFMGDIRQELGDLPAAVADTIRAYATTGDARLLAETLGNYTNANKAIVSLPPHLREVLPADVFSNMLKELDLSEVVQAPAIIDKYIDTQIDLLQDQLTAVPHVTGTGHSYFNMTQDMNVASLLTANPQATVLAQQIKAADARFISFISANPAQSDIVYSLWRQVQNLDLTARAKQGDIWQSYQEGAIAFANYQKAVSQVWGERNSSLLKFLNSPTTIPPLPSLPLSAMPAENYPALDAAMRAPVTGPSIPGQINAGRELLDKAYNALLMYAPKFKDKGAFADILLSAKHDNWTLGVHAQKIVDRAFKKWRSIPAHNAFGSPMEFRNAVFREMRYLELQRVSQGIDMAELAMQKSALMEGLAYNLSNGPQARLIFTDGPLATISVGTQRFTIPTIDVPPDVRYTYTQIAGLTDQAQFRTLEQILADFPPGLPAPTRFTATIGTQTIESLDEQAALLAEKYLGTNGSVVLMPASAPIDEIIEANRISMDVRHAQLFDAPISDPFPDNPTFTTWLSAQVGEPATYNNDFYTIQNIDLTGADLVSSVGATVRVRLDEFYINSLATKYADTEMSLMSLADYKHTNLIPTLSGVDIHNLPVPENPLLMQETAIAHIDSLQDARQLLQSSLQRTGTMTGPQVEAIRSAGARVAEKLSEFASIAHEAAHWAVKDAMIGSAKKYPIDILLRAAAPFPTFYTRSYYNIFRRMLMQPRYYMTQYKVYEAINKSNEQQGFGQYDGQTIVFTTPDGGKHTLPNPLLRLMPVAPMTGQQSYGNDTLGLYKTGLGYHAYISALTNAANGNIVASVAQYTSQGRLIGDAYQWYTGRPMPGFDSDAQYRQTTNVIVEQAKNGLISKGESVAALAIMRSYYQNTPYPTELVAEYPTAIAIYEKANQEGGKRSFYADATGFLTGFRYNTLSKEKAELATIAQRGRDNRDSIGIPGTYATRSGARQRYEFPGGSAYAAIGSVFNADYTPPENSAMLTAYYEKLDTLFTDMFAAREKAVKDLYAKDNAPKLGEISAVAKKAEAEYWTRFESLKKQYEKWQFPPGALARYSPEEEGDNKLQEIFAKAGDYAPYPTENYDKWYNGQIDWIYSEYQKSHGPDDAILFTKDEIKLKFYLDQNRRMSEFEKNLRIEILKSNAEYFGGDLSYIPQREYDRYVQARAGGQLDLSNYTSSGVPIGVAYSPPILPGTQGTGTTTSAATDATAGTTAVKTGSTTVNANSGLRLGKDATGYFAIDSAGVKQYTAKDSKGFFIVDSATGEKVYTQLFVSSNSKEAQAGPGTLREGETRDRNGLIIRQFPTYSPRPRSSGGGSSSGSGSSSVATTGGPLGFDANGLYEILRYEGDYAIILYNGKLYRVHKLYLSQLRGFKPEPQRIRQSLLLSESR